MYVPLFMCHPVHTKNGKRCISEKKLLPNHIAYSNYRINRKQRIIDRIFYVMLKCLPSEIKVIFEWTNTKPILKVVTLCIVS